MRVKKYAVFFLMLAVMLFAGTFDAFSQVTTLGKEFWFGFMENNGIPPEAPDQGIVVITASEPSDGVLEYNGRSFPFSLATGQQFFHRIDDFDILHRTSGMIESKGVYIISSGNVSVYAFNERFRSADGTVILPITTLGKDYFITSHFEVMTTTVNYEANQNNESTLLVVGVENNTRVEITPSVWTLTGNAPLVPFFIDLNRGQSYQIKARGDLTGTRVRVVGENVEECKNLAVFGGNKWSSVGDCGQANDNLFQQAYPVNTWGTEFFHIPLAGRSSGELVKVLASEDNTSVFVDGVFRGNINSGKFLSFNFNANQLATIRTDKPSSVTVFAKSQACNDPNLPLFNDGDPFMITYSPNQQLLKTITFNALQLPSITSHYVNIIVKTASKDRTRLDGNNVGNQFLQIPGSSEYSYARIPIFQGAHTMTNPDGLIGYVYGFGYIESYGFAVGANLDNLNFETENQYDFEVIGEKVACYNKEGLWEINPENELFTYFVWDFGDGSDPVVGKKVPHTYTEPGEYEIKIIAAISENSCDEQQEVKFNVTVEKTEAEIRGLAKACPNVEEITYGLVTDMDFSKVDWRAEGGEIIDIDEENQQATVRWGAANPNAKIIALPYTSEGCPGEEIVYTVVINPLIDASVPEGLSEICFDPNRLDEYNVPLEYANRGYEWFIEGGEFVNGNEGSKIQVRWINQGITGKIWYREYSLLDDFCEGTSPKLEVVVNPLLEASVSSKENVLCFGQSNGKIELLVKGGKAPYKYEWSHAPTLNAPNALSLSAGNYSVKITDSFGCFVLVENVEITQPQLLELVSVDIEGTTCFGRPDGIANIIVQGGVMPYTIDFPSDNIVDGNIILEGLEGTSQSYLVTDANGCSIPVAFQVESPMPAIAEVRIQKASCPGQSNGELYVAETKGIGPFSYTWQYNNTQGSTLTGVPKGEYEVSIRDSRGCISEGKGQVVEEMPVFRMPTGFIPSDGLYAPVANCEVPFLLKIFNRWGGLVYSGDSGWDGKVNGEDAPIGSYTYVILLEVSVNGKLTTAEDKGVFALLR
ncbi:PKD domain-containing protein [Aquiflexum gelatinilyticum]|uniref:PKD domain-containing protein n=1 Tax=Aquiflexum gelatinilyticum TaxID=2961943 RepID=UPI002168EB19|nr:PKD domain-containing protein [Aquiflexum gelatinilyticum]MCS4432938.1 PKD domain-containing protein [Aquiflexum gelatinilyticum]